MHACVCVKETKRLLDNRQEEYVGKCRRGKLNLNKTKLVIGKQNNMWTELMQINIAGKMHAAALPSPFQSNKAPDSFPIK